MIWIAASALPSGRFHLEYIALNSDADSLRGSDALEGADLLATSYKAKNRAPELGTRTLLEIFRDLLEFIDWTAISSRHRPHSNLETVIDVVVDQNLLCCANRVLHCVQLLHYLETRAVVLDHVDHVSEMAIQALEALDNLRVSLMRPIG
jgi:hypothetical protein